MPTSFLPYQPDQDLLLPPSLQEWLPEGHLAFFVSDVVDRLDLKDFYARYEGDGRRNQPYDPRMMVKVMLYAYATGTFSSRRIARKLSEDVAYRVLGAGNVPAHRTIAQFRQEHLSAFQNLFIAVVVLARELKLVTLGTLAIDGTKVKANASKHKAMSYARMRDEEARLKHEIAVLFEQAHAEDEREDRALGHEARGDALPQELARREQRLAAIEAARQRLEARTREADRARGRTPDDEHRPRGGGRGARYQRPFGIPKDSAQENFTDPDSRILKAGAAFVQGYNAQAAVDGASQLIVAAGLSNNASDARELLPLIEATQYNTGATPRELLADAGYRSETNLAALEGKPIDSYIALGREGKQALTDNTEKYPATARMAEKLATPQGRARYARRKVIPEPVFGWIKHILGFRQFSLRGLAKTSGEWAMVCLACNLRRLRVLDPACGGGG
ncbi:MAG: IS1182 family transposase [Comamonadaceae bacterium]|nr:IS1182 family transposase [Comamonadaceae bacterium]